MTIIISIVGMIGRAAGGLLTSALGWASSLLFGRVPRSHQMFVTLIMAGSLLWIAMVLLAVIPGVISILLDTTPHPPAVGLPLVRLVVLGGAIFLPAGVGLAAYMAPAREDRPTGLGAVRQVLMGYPLAFAMAGILIFLAGVGIARKVSNARRGWSETHIPIVVKPGGYEQMVADLLVALAEVELAVEPRDAPRVLVVPGRILAALADGNVRSLVPDRLVDLSGPNLEIGLYPSDIAIAGAQRERTTARATLMRRMMWTSAHLTTSAEAQSIEDRIQTLARRDAGRAGPANAAGFRAALATIDHDLVEANLPEDEWDILYRLRIQLERDLLVDHPAATVSRARSPRTAAAPAATAPEPLPAAASVTAGGSEVRVG